jgi:hypothetical protein
MKRFADLIEAQLVEHRKKLKKHHHKKRYGYVTHPYGWVGRCWQNAGSDAGSGITTSADVSGADCGAADGGGGGGGA